jgi:Fe-S-cluster containining protein
MKKNRMNEELIIQAKLKFTENNQFVKFLRSQSASAIDQLAQPLVQEVYEKTDCLACGNCCKRLRAPFQSEESSKIAQSINLSIDSFNSKYLESVPLKDYGIMKQNPCLFLDGNTCTIYCNRPSSCADYPHLHHNGFKYRIKSIMENYSVCPMVVTVIEQLKSKIGFTI